MNPAYMTRQVHELGAEEYGIFGHITSLNPIRPENKPDLWEAGALQRLEDGEKEVSSLEQIEGEQFMRLMGPLITEEGCLKCHAKQGYQLGDIRGGISVSVPIAPLWASVQSHIYTMALGHMFLGALGLVGIVLGTRAMNWNCAFGNAPLIYWS